MIFLNRTASKRTTIENLSTTRTVGAEDSSNAVKEQCKSVECKVWSVKCKVWNVECGV